MEFLKSAVPSLLSLYCIIQMLNTHTQVTMSQHVELETAYSSTPYLDESASFVSASHNIYVYNGQSSTKKDTIFTWTNLLTTETSADTSEVSAMRAASHVTDSKDTTETKRKYWKMTFGGEAMTLISPKQPYCIHRDSATRRAYFNHYSAQQDGVSMPNTDKIVPFGGEDICSCLVRIQRHYLINSHKRFGKADRSI
ncbi:Actin-related protein 9 [Cardamine amara subsp. amara]|uniref:Actin-related protein 9 n=1 Tax=Cardamine amara subsp. amara TaxID=228776 RepID=A0ABD0ZMM2_CARAN